jgi:hypothetical protein
MLVPRLITHWHWDDARSDGVLQITGAQVVRPSGGTNPKAIGIV